MVLYPIHMFQHTAARRRLALLYRPAPARLFVSTHSRPKAAGPVASEKPHNPKGFNTQPPEGGWVSQKPCYQTDERFQHTAARRRLVLGKDEYFLKVWFQHTAARRRLGPTMYLSIGTTRFQHTAARRRLAMRPICT